ncbi:MAG: tyrosine protein kinase [Thermobacillus sp.]|nr:MAG: tyrosine protein kinase [Thermobacillus sp.]
MITVNHYTHLPGSRGFTQLPGAGAPFPGGPQAGPPADPFAGPPAYLQSVQYPGLIPAQGAAKPGGLPNLADLKLIIDRMGGIEGILSTIQKVQKIVGTVQQFAPMIKLLAGSLGSKKTAAAASTNTERRPRRRRRRGGRRPRSGRARRGSRRRAGIRSFDEMF